MYGLISRLHSIVKGVTVACSHKTKSFTTFRMLKGLSNTIKSKLQSLLKISKNLLHRRRKVLPLVISDYYLTLLFKALFLLAYYACLRAGEIDLDQSQTRFFDFPKPTLC